MKQLNMALLAALLALASGCSKVDGPGAAAGDASPHTLKVNAQFAKDLNLDDPQDFEDARRGFIARPTGKIVAADGTVLTDFDAYNFVDGKAPDTVNPSLWRHARLNANIGLFKVTDGVYQLRGFDMGNMTLIEGTTGWIVVDALTARETASAALTFARQQLGNKPVSAVQGECGYSGRTAVADASRIAEEEMGVPITNTTMLGALMKAAGLIKPESIAGPLADRFGKIADKNRRSLERAYAETVIAESGQ